MSDMTGRLRDLTRNLDGTWNLTVTVDQDCRGMFDDLRDKDIDVEVKKHRHRRSLDANAYCWVLCDKIAATKGLLLKKSEVYKRAIRDYGVTAVMPVQNDLLKDILAWHTKNGLGNDTDVLGASKFDGYTNVRFYYGSSGYDTKQMSVLLDGIIADAQELGIQTGTPDQIERMKAEWGT